MALTEAMRRREAALTSSIHPAAVGLEHSKVVGELAIEGDLCRPGFVATCHRRNKWRAVGEGGSDEQDGFGATEQGAIKNEPGERDSRNKVVRSW